MIDQIAGFLSAVEWKAILPAVAALSGVWLQNRLTSRRAFVDRVWDLRREAYAEVIANLTDAEISIADILNNVSEDSLDEEASDELKDMLKRMIDQTRGLQRRLSRDSIILSEDFDKLLRAFNESLKQREGTGIEKIRAARTAMEDFRTKVTALARRELTRR